MLESGPNEQSGLSGLSEVKGRGRRTTEAVCNRRARTAGLLRTPARRRPPRRPRRWQLRPRPTPIRKSLPRPGRSPPAIPIPRPRPRRTTPRPRRTTPRPPLLPRAYVPIQMPPPTPRRPPAPACPHLTRRRAPRTCPRPISPLTSIGRRRRHPLARLRITPLLCQLPANRASRCHIHRLSGDHRILPVLLRRRVRRPRADLNHNWLRHNRHMSTAHHHLIPRPLWPPCKTQPAVPGVLVFRVLAWLMGERGIHFVIAPIL